MKLPRTWLKDLRKSKDVSQKRICIALGVKRQAVSGWESGQKTPSLWNVFELEALLGAEVIEKFRAEHREEKRREVLAASFLAAEKNRKDREARYKGYDPAEIEAFRFPEESIETAVTRFEMKKRWEAEQAQSAEEVPAA